MEINKTLKVLGGIFVNIYREINLNIDHKTVRERTKQSEDSLSIKKNYHNQGNYHKDAHWSQNDRWTQWELQQKLQNIKIDNHSWRIQYLEWKIH